MTEKLTGELSEEEIKILRDMHSTSLELGILILHRLTMAKNYVEDKHPNSWWRHYNREIGIKLRIMESLTQQYKEPKNV